MPGPRIGSACFLCGSSLPRSEYVVSRWDRRTRGFAPKALARFVVTGKEQGKPFGRSCARLLLCSGTPEFSVLCPSLRSFAALPLGGGCFVSDRPFCCAGGAPLGRLPSASHRVWPVDFLTLHHPPSGRLGASETLLRIAWLIAGGLCDAAPSSLSRPRPALLRAAAGLILYYKFYNSRRWETR